MYLIKTEIYSIVLNFQCLPFVLMTNLDKYFISVSHYAFKFSTASQANITPPGAKYSQLLMAATNPT